MPNARPGRKPKSPARWFFCRFQAVTSPMPLSQVPPVQLDPPLAITNAWLSLWKVSVERVK
ncbi:hypothetical protein DFO53_1572 [Enterobacter sp. AG5470]|nr:hypothetical protein DFO53_1572 [Enterobacter sp. AG5470]